MNTNISKKITTGIIILLIPMSITSVKADNGQGVIENSPKKKAIIYLDNGTKDISEVRAKLKNNPKYIQDKISTFSHINDKIESVEVYNKNSLKKKIKQRKKFHKILVKAYQNDIKNQQILKHLENNSLELQGLYKIRNMYHGNNEQELNKDKNKRIDKNMSPDMITKKFYNRFNREQKKDFKRVKQSDIRKLNNGDYSIRKHNKKKMNKKRTRN